MCAAGCRRQGALPKQNKADLSNTAEEMGRCCRLPFTEERGLKTGTTNVRTTFIGSITRKH